MSMVAARTVEFVREERVRFLKVVGLVDALLDVDTIGTHTRDVLIEERVRLSAVITAIDDLLTIEGWSPSGTDERKRHDVPTGNRPGRKSKYDWDLGEEMYGHSASVREIADRLGSSISAVKGRVRVKGWRREKSADDQPRPRPTSLPAAEDPPVTVECPNCERVTGFTGKKRPACEHCGVVLPSGIAQRLMASLGDDA